MKITKLITAKKSVIEQVNQTMSSNIKFLANSCLDACGCTGNGVC